MDIEDVSEMQLTPTSLAIVPPLNPRVYLFTDPYKYLYLCMDFNEIQYDTIHHS
jgi:hypothetical protein